MTVREYVFNNSEKFSYTIKIGRKSYLCNSSEAVGIFGDRMVAKITNRYSENTPCLHLL